ncbi:MAG: hypothetical protein AAGI71_12435 [Bacteroidota bacterium]
MKRVLPSLRTVRWIMLPILAFFGAAILGAQLRLHVLTPTLDAVAQVLGLYPTRLLTFVEIAHMSNKIVHGALLVLLAVWIAPSHRLWVGVAAFTLTIGAAALQLIAPLSVVALHTTVDQYLSPALSLALGGALALSGYMGWRLLQARSAPFAGAST